MLDRKIGWACIGKRLEGKDKKFMVEVGEKGNPKRGMT